MVEPALNTADRLAAARSVLFVPGSRPDRFTKARDSGADAIVLDLEDSVASDGKVEAREHVVAWLASGEWGIVRVNGPGTPWFDDDVAALRRVPAPVMVPKATAPGPLAELRDRLDGIPLIPILESAAAVHDARELCAVPGVVRVVFGNGDLARELDVDHADHVALAYARSAVVLASAAAEVAPPLDGVTTSLEDEAITADARRAARVGFGGKMCVHPRQVPAVNQAFLPTDAEVARARRIVERAPADGAAAVVDGEMVDAPVLARAHRVLRRHALHVPGSRERPGEGQDDR